MSKQKFMMMIWLGTMIAVIGGIGIWVLIFSLSYPQIN